jgi:hypothetical protein
MIRIKKDEWQEKLNQQDNELVAFNPELSQGLSYDYEGNRLPKHKIEQFDYIPRGFIDSGIIFKLPKKAIQLYMFLSSKCNKHRNTRITDLEIVRMTGLKKITIRRSLSRLKYYHLIRSRIYYVRPKMRRRVTVLLRWETAYPELCRENKIIAFSSKDVSSMIADYKPKKELK